MPTSPPAAPRLRLQPPWDAAAAAPPGALRPSGGPFRRRLRALRLANRPGVTMRGVASVGAGVRVEVASGARLVLGDGAVLHDGCRLHVRGGVLEIGPGAVIGGRCALVAHEAIRIGERARLGDGVVAQDGRPLTDDVERPVRTQGLRTAPVTVGRLARIGPGVVLEAGATVPPQTAVAAHRVLAGPARP